jgi:phosphomannomutase
VNSRAAIGLAQDLDADRLALVDETGAPAGEERTIVLAVAHLLSRFAAAPRTVVKNLVTTRAVDDLALEAGVPMIETPVGEIHLSRALAAESASGREAFGGEGNGGVIFPRVSPGRDSLAGTALALEALARDGRPLSARIEALPRYHMEKAKIALGDPRALFERARALFPDAHESRLDGLKLDFSDGSWLALRASNTEPVIRAVAESRSRAWAGEVLSRLLTAAR